jgi:hypothetical protein
MLTYALGGDRAAGAALGPSRRTPGIV